MGLSVFGSPVGQQCDGAARHYRGNRSDRCRTDHTERWVWLWWRLAQSRIYCDNPDEVGAASFDYLMYSGYVTMAYFWALMAQKAHEKLATGEGDEDFLKAKIQTAEFYFERLLPRAKGHAESMMAGTKSLMQMDTEHFSFD
ncbi:MAG: acyl-CoA dehydrogenase C-terminal domain-containing protein [Ketobacteraceae bacterium]|nr:acyl-CoA dehydrogenase C-terminal domain-containing protein [Ketobacteraceae bacterium]